MKAIAFVRLLWLGAGSGLQLVYVVWLPCTAEPAVEALVGSVAGDTCDPANAAGTGIGPSASSGSGTGGGGGGGIPGEQGTPGGGSGVQTNDVRADTSASGMDGKHACSGHRRA